MAMKVMMTAMTTAVRVVIVIAETMEAAQVVMVVKTSTPITWCQSYVYISVIEI